tara:strand:+ start:3231 stop:3998 length:768 start_codon:yes stop_codon:yes gene_type:complete
MQLVSRYLVKNHSVVVIDDFAGNVEYRKLYQRNIKVTKGIDNVISFEIKNGDHKPVSILNTYTPYVEVFTEDKVLLKRYTGTIKETSTPLYKGQFTINITDSDTLNIDGQYMSYVVYLNKTADGTNTLTYADTQYGPSGTIELSGRAFPGPLDSKSVTTWISNISSVVDAQPQMNSNEALHTVAIYTTGFDGTVKVQGTLGTSDSSSWFDITTETLASPSTPHYVNFNGVFSNLRFVKANDSNNVGTVDKILVRN